MELTSLADLLDVQALDTQIDRLLEERQSLPELESYRQTHELVTSLESDLAKARGELRELDLALDKAEGELEILEAKLEEHETRLFAGGMSARETEHMRLEVQSLKGQKDALEERVLSFLEKVDPAREMVAALESEIDAGSQTRGELEAGIKEQWKRIDAEIARKEQRKAEAIGPISGDLIELYEKLRRIKEGVAIAPFDHGVCGGCHMTLSPTEQEEAFKEELPRCVHCRRLLVA